MTGPTHTDEAKVAERLMDVRRHVKVFVNNLPNNLGNEINQWLDANPRAEILEFFPVSISTSTAIGLATTVGAVRVSTREDSGYSSGGDSRVEERTRETQIAAVGIYYAEPKEGA